MSFPPLPDPVQMMEALNLNASPISIQETNNNNEKQVAKPKIINCRKVNINMTVLKKKLEEEEAICMRKKTNPMRPNRTLKIVEIN